MSYPLGMTDVGLDPLIREEATHYVLPLVGREVDQLCIDYAVTLVVEGTDTVRLESPFTLHARVLASIRREARNARAGRKGYLAAKVNALHVHGCRACAKRK